MSDESMHCHRKGRPCEFALKGANAQQGGLTRLYDGVRPQHNNVSLTQQHERVAGYVCYVLPADFCKSALIPGPPTCSTTL